MADLKRIEETIKGLVEEFGFKSGFIYAPGCEGDKDAVVRGIAMAFDDQALEEVAHALLENLLHGKQTTNT